MARNESFEGRVVALAEATGKSYPLKPEEIDGIEVVFSIERSVSFTAKGADKITLAGLLWMNSHESPAKERGSYSDVIDIGESEHGRAALEAVRKFFGQYWFDENRRLPFIKELKQTNTILVLRQGR